MHAYVTSRYSIAIFVAGRFAMVKFYSSISSRTPDRLISPLLSPSKTSCLIFAVFLWVESHGSVNLRLDRRIGSDEFYIRSYDSAMANGSWFPGWAPFNSTSAFRFVFSAWADDLAGSGMVSMDNFTTSVDCLVGEFGHAWTCLHSDTLLHRDTCCSLKGIEAADVQY